jgi:hypothetical protein
VKISVVRRGGLAGISFRGSVNTRELGDRMASVESALQVLPDGKPAGPPTHPDSFQYELQMEDGKTISLDESELTDDLQPLVDLAMEHGSLD